MGPEPSASVVLSSRPCLSPSTPSQPTKILYVISDLSIGGAEMALYRLLSKTDKRRFEPVVVSLIDRGSLRKRIEELGVEVHTLGLRAERPSPFGLLRLVRLFKKLRPNLIVGWMQHSCLAAELANTFTRKRIPTIWSLHSILSSSLPEKKWTVLSATLCRLLSKLPAKIVLVSHVAQQQLELVRYHADKSCVIPNGIDVERFVPSREAHLKLRRELGLGPGATIIGLVGRYHPVKGHVNFLRAAALVVAEKPDIHFLLAGSGVDGENQELVRVIDQHNLTDHVHLLGEREDTPDLMAALDIFALSSFEESCPNVICEAMACGVPCVVTNVGDAALIIGDTGRVVPSGNSSALATGLIELLELGEVGRRSLGINARTRVIELFKLESIVERYESLYESVVTADQPREITAVDPADVAASWKTSLIHGSDNL